ncbi:MAG: nucleotide sugar dehydrogenase [Planctomycetota bacterium]|nr:MAG: nucleotide sugar dehydrogenase [Planctomycetota bacterium]
MTQTVTNHAAELNDKIRTKAALVGIIGLGYVGLPLADALHTGGMRILGFDVDQKKIDYLAKGENYLKHLGADMTTRLSESGRFEATVDFTRLNEPDIILVCVPTPVGPHLEPDLTYVLNTAEAIGKRLRAGQLVVLESTTYPGTTREDFIPVMLKAAEAAGRGKFEIGKDVFVAFSPEREDPGRKSHTTTTIPKLVGGVDATSTDLACAIYAHGVTQVVPVTSADVAEAAKILENVFRAVNIAMVNELKMVFDAMGIDVWEVIQAASTKPFGFMPFYPGPGLGGHCIPIDPFYLTWKAREHGRVTRFIELAGEINRGMPEWVVEKTAEALNDDSKSVKGSRIIVVGLAYKPNVDDTRETPAAEIIELLAKRGAKVSYHDPLVPHFPEMRNYSFSMDSVPLDETTLKASDCILIVTDHDVTDWQAIADHATLVVDTRNALSRLPGKPKARVVKA